MNVIVKSKDGVEFAVETAGPARQFEIAFAQTRTAAELRLHGDFTELRDLELVPGKYNVEVRQVAPEFVFEAPRIASPLERRAAFKVIKGGKP